MENDFRDILNNYINGDNQAIEEIYFELKNRLLLIAYNYSRDKNVSKDIVHDVFEKLFHLTIENRKKYFSDSHNSLIAYLTIFIKNKCIDLKKTRTNRERIIQSIRHTFNTESENSSLEKFIYDALKEMLNSLQPREKEILKLHLEGYSNDEIAKYLGISYNSVKNNIYEAKKKLKELWSIFMN